MWCCINNSTCNVEFAYLPSGIKTPHGFPWNDPTLYTHMEMPEGVDLAVMKPVPDGNNFTFHLNEELMASNMANKIAALRYERNNLLNKSDWTQLADIPIQMQLSWREYRQALRDLPANTSNVDSPPWPLPPN